MASVNEKKPPRWSLDSVYRGFDDPAYLSAKTGLGRLASDYLSHLDQAPSIKDSAGFAPWLKTALALEEEIATLSRTLGSYCGAVYTTNTGDARAMAEVNSVEEIALPLAKASVLFSNALAARERETRALAASDPEISKFSFRLEDALFWQKKQLSPSEEDLAADLARSGADAWGRLQEQLTSTASCVWDEATGERKTLVELRSLAYDADRGVREKAFNKEIECCRSIELPVAACINGIKGANHTMNTRRGWPMDLDKAAAQGRLSEKALNALIGAMEESLPQWRRYLKAKARLMGLSDLKFYDLFAPVGSDFPVYTWEEVERTVIDNFDSFSKRLGDFARKAFAERWIDAEPRAGKVGGAYCTDMPAVKETRVLCNFDGSFNTVSTVAHELGHAFHSDVLKDESPLHQDYPMTLAETASIFAETIVFHSVLGKATDDQRLGLLETHLQDGCQILVDILSRFYFERSVFETRSKAELPAAELCEKMLAAQRATYGDGLGGDGYHPYMWLVKPHYYNYGLDFYNFPYAFGQLFGMALYARYQAEGPGFARSYEALLLETGRMDAVALTAKAGFDIEDPDFWRGGVALFMDEIDGFVKIVEEKTK